MTPCERADVAIADHVLWSLGAAAVPLPLLDIAAVTAVQLDLVADLARIYDVDWEPTSGRALVSAVVGASLPRVGASAVKALPGAGWVAGALAQVGLSGASTWALGQVFKQHFEGRRRFDPIDVKVLRQRYERRFAERREAERRPRRPRERGERPAARPTERRAEASERPQPRRGERVYDARRARRLSRILEELEQLRASALISDAEYQKLKTQALRNG